MYGWQEFDLVLSGAIWAVAVVAWFFCGDRVGSPDSCRRSRFLPRSHSPLSCLTLDSQVDHFPSQRCTA